MSSVEKGPSLRYIGGELVALGMAHFCALLLLRHHSHLDYCPTHFTLTRSINSNLCTCSLLTLPLAQFNSTGSSRNRYVSAFSLQRLFFSHSPFNPNTMTSNSMSDTL